MKDFLGDMIIRIKNGQKVHLKEIKLNPFSPKYCISILTLLQKEGYIYGFFVSNKTCEIKVFLKYNNTGIPVIKNVFRISKPGRRVYLTTKALWKPKSTLGVYIISTPKGFLTDKEARLLNVGGEVLFGIY